MNFLKLFFVPGILFFLLSCSSDENAGNFIPQISVYQVKAQDVPIYQDFVGQMYGLKDISILARVEGFLESIYFQEGRPVKRGKLLYTIESQPYEAEVAARMSELAEAKTLLANAESELNRIRPLAENNAVSQSDLDAAIARYDASKASVEAAEANLKAAQIKLSYTRIHSPISGIIGKTKAKVGDFVGRQPNPVILNVVSRVDTVLVEFYLPESQYLEFFREFSKDKVEESNRNSLQLILADGSILPDKGYVKFLDREVDPTTGAILVQAAFPNNSNILRPGLFAKVRAEVDVVNDGLLIPQRSVMEIQGLQNVYVVNDENKIELREVKLGPTINSSWLVKEGLKDGERIVYEGLQKVKPGMQINPVIVKNENKTRETGN